MTPEKGKSFLYKGSGLQASLFDKKAFELGKLPPQALELEIAVLGAIMLEKGALGQVVDVLSPEDFYEPSHAMIYRAIQELYHESQPVDMRTVVAQLRKSGNLEKVGNSHFIAELTAKVSSAANVESHARYVAEQAMKRKLILAASEIQNNCYADTSDPFELLDKTQAVIDGISLKYIRRPAQSAEDIYEAAIEQHTKARSMEGLVGVPSGFTSLDRITSGWLSPDLIIIAARPGMGKTAFVVTALRNAAIDFKIPVALFSLEMSSLQIMNRLISSETEIELEKITKGRTDANEFARMMQTSGLSKAPIFIDDTPALSILEVRAKARRLKAEHNVRLIVVDYLQLMRGDSSGNREQEISSISRGLKSIAKELNIPVIALSQLSRSVETRGGDKKPQLSDLRESGAIEQDADIVIFLYRAEYYEIWEYENGAPTHGTMQAIFAKHRNGGLDTVMLRFIGRFTQIKDLDQPLRPQSATSERPAPGQSYKDRQVGKDQHGNDDVPQF